MCCVAASACDHTPRSTCDHAPRRPGVLLVVVASSEAWWIATIRAAGFACGASYASFFPGSQPHKLEPRPMRNFEPQALGKAHHSPHTVLTPQDLRRRTPDRPTTRNAALYFLCVWRRTNARLDVTCGGGRLATLHTQGDAKCKVSVVTGRVAVFPHRLQLRSGPL